MIVPGSASPLLTTTDGGYTIAKSLRFRGSAQGYLSKTPTSSGNRKTYTMSFWVKRGSIGTGSYQYLFGTFPTSSTEFNFAFTNSDTLSLSDYPSSDNILLVTNQVFRDPSAWYHIVAAVDTTQATSTNRAKLYINGVQVTSFNLPVYPTQNSDTLVWDTSSASAIGTRGRTFASTSQFDGYMSDVYFIDGQALTPSSFGETDTTTGVWKPKAYSGTYGTNGFYLKFTDVATTSGSNAGLGKDFSGNGNYWTTNNISVTAGSTYDSMTDVPTLTSATAANYCVLNPLDKKGSGTLTDGNLNYATSTSTYDPIRGTVGVSSGKWYWEVTCTGQSGSSANTFFTGIASITSSIITSGDYVGADTNSYSYYGASGNKYNNNVSVAYGSTYTTNDIIGVALDMDAGTLVFYKNNTSQGTAYSTGLTGKTITAYLGNGNGTGASQYYSCNFGQRPFAYTAPSGYKALCTQNLPTPTIGATSTTQANKYFDVVLRNGAAPSGATFSTNVNMANGALIWDKPRNAAYNNYLLDSVRGVSKYLISDSTATEASSTTYFTNFGTNSFTTGSGDWTSSTTVVDWIWAANGSGSTNTAGSITSTVSANTTSGFSIVTYTGTGTNATIGHGLGVAPSMIISKSRSNALDWDVYHSALGPNYWLRLNSTIAAVNNSAMWRNVSPTSTVWSIGTDTENNTNGATYVAYCFAEVAGYSKFGSYTGNGSSDGPFVFTGMRPAYVMVKNITGTQGNWVIYDTTRSTYNLSSAKLAANLSVAENDGANLGGDTIGIDILSNGFKIRTTGNNHNNSGETYIFAAFASAPLKYSLAR